MKGYIKFPLSFISKIPQII
ncbi:TPA: hypothetical protein J9755_000145 [Escherichia coli]|nr:hypothetical protein [Escherichia coli]HBB2900312.1 hypothetical protein [Escherichia coli]